MLSYLRRRSDRDVAEDLCAEVFTRAWRKWPPQGNHLPWLYGIAHNVILEFYRERSRESEQTARLNHDQGSQVVTSPEEVIVAHNAIIEALNQLSESDQEVLRLHTWEALSVDELAVALSVSAGTARVRLHRARKRLQEVLSADTSQNPNRRSSQPKTRTGQHHTDTGQGNQHRKAGSHE